MGIGQRAQSKPLNLITDVTFVFRTALLLLSLKGNPLCA